MDTQSDTVNIKQFLTPKSEIYYTKVMNIIEDMTRKELYQSVFISEELNIYIYGGFIREIISHYFHPEDEFIPSTDVDLWFSFYDSNKEEYSYPYSIWVHRCGKLIKSLGETHDISKADTSNKIKTDETYSIYNINIDEIDFDFNVKTSFYSSYKTISDFTVNSLTMDTNGNIFKRLPEYCDFDINEIITHIKERKLIKMINPDAIKVGYTTEQIQTERFIKREQKMINYGYTY
jgi:hypothetical protein